MAGHYGGVQISVSDGFASDTESIALDVLNTNRAPILVNIRNRRPGRRLLQFSLLAMTRMQRVVYDLPVMSSTALELARSRERLLQLGTHFRMDAGYEQAGSYTLTFTAADASGAVDSLDSR